MTEPNHGTLTAEEVEAYAELISAFFQRNGRDPRREEFGTIVDAARMIAAEKRPILVGQLRRLLLQGVLLWSALFAASPPQPVEFIDEVGVALSKNQRSGKLGRTGDPDLDE